MQHTKQIFIVAVSGGVDSVVLLHMLVNHDASIANSIPENSDFIVAHVNHGIRGESSATDQQFVRELAQKLGLRFETCDLNLGSDASEELARTERYQFLDKLISKYHASSVILAHHSDDVVETAIINYIRGTGRRGLSSLVSTSNRSRPLLHLTKEQILDYAKEHGLSWVEDETNSDTKYLRNRLRKKLNTAELTQTKASFATELQKVKHTNTQLDIEIAKILQYRIRDKYILSRSWFVKLPHEVACEIMHATLMKLETQNINRKLVESLTVALKVAKPGTKLDIDKNTVGLITKRSLRFVSRKTLKTHKM